MIIKGLYVSETLKSLMSHIIFSCIKAPVSPLVTEVCRFKNILLDNRIFELCDLDEVEKESHCFCTIHTIRNVKV